MEIFVLCALLIIVIGLSIYLFLSRSKSSSDDTMSSRRFGAALSSSSIPSASCVADINGQYSDLNSCTTSCKQTTSLPSGIYTISQVSGGVTKYFTDMNGGGSSGFKRNVVALDTPISNYIYWNYNSDNGTLQSLGSNQYVNFTPNPSNPNNPGTLDLATAASGSVILTQANHALFNGTYCAYNNVSADPNAVGADVCTKLASNPAAVWKFQPVQMKYSCINSF